MTQTVRRMGSNDIRRNAEGLHLSNLHESASPLIVHSADFDKRIERIKVRNQTVGVDKLHHLETDSDKKSGKLGVSDYATLLRLHKCKTWTASCAN